MHVFRDSASIRHAAEQLPEVASPLSRRIEELSEYDDYDLAELAHVLVVQPGDTLADVEAAIGFSVETRALDAIDSHPGCYELTYVLRDDGFGLLVYVPKTPGIDRGLLDLCAARSPGAAR